MELTRKCKREFKSWYLGQSYCALDITESEKEQTWKSFLAMDLPFKYGVLEDYFDSVGIYIGIFPIARPTISGGIFDKFKVEILNKSFFVNVGRGSDKKDVARLIAIEKANEIRNQQLK